jgi:ABC-type branched-subunit amino acid transport system substrate-binding protein
MPNHNNPYRIGVLHDWLIGHRNTRDFYDALDLGFDEALAQGVLDRPVELIVREAEGYPMGPDDVVVDTWQRMVDEDNVLGIIGPQIAQPAVIIRDRTNEIGMPMISYSGSPDLYGDYWFSANNCMFADEAQIVSRFLDKIGVRRVAIVSEDNAQGNESMRYYPRVFKQAGLDIVASEHVMDPMTNATGVRPYLERLRAAKPDVLLYVGNGYLLRALTPALEAMGWDPLRMTHTPFVIGTVFDWGPEVLEGWYGIDQFDERNSVFQRFLDAFDERFGRRPVHMYSAIGYDTARLIAHGLSLAPEESREGLKLGLEQIRMLPAAVGSEGNIMSFWRHDHRAWKGKFWVIRRIRNGVNEIVE